MRLRNKKIGEIRNAVDIDMYTDSVYLQISDSEFNNKTIKYHPLTELNEEWEDYAPKEPLIKDEKIRQIIKAWAKVNEAVSVFIKVVKDAEEGYLYWELASTNWEQSITIRFGGELPDTLEDMETYTIEELCGEEDRWNYWEMLKAISPYDYTKRNKLTNHT